MFPSFLETSVLVAGALKLFLLCTTNTWLHGDVQDAGRRWWIVSRERSASLCVYPHECVSWVGDQECSNDHCHFSTKTVMLTLSLPLKIRQLSYNLFLLKYLFLTIEFSSLQGICIIAWSCFKLWDNCYTYCTDTQVIISVHLGFFFFNFLQYVISLNKKVSIVFIGMQENYTWPCWRTGMAPVP